MFQSNVVGKLHDHNSFADAAAPPKRPILPPFAYGTNRTTTLMPVSNCCAVVIISVDAVAGLWMA